MTLRARLIELARHFPEKGIKLLLENPLNDRELFAIQGDALFRGIDLTQLKLERTTFVQRDYRHIESDIVLPAPLLDRHGKATGRRIIVYILIEHQSTPDALIVFRELEYVIAICKHQLRQALRKKRKLARFRFQPVLPIIFYTGTKR
jgi:predicted transposase YdaD